MTRGYLINNLNCLRQLKSWLFEIFNVDAHNLRSTQLFKT